MRIAVLCSLELMASQIDELPVKITLSDSALNLFRPASWIELEIEPE